MEATPDVDSPAVEAPAPMTPANEAAEDKLKRKRQPRNSACQGCAQLKMKVD
jgi:hypothetical protein